MVTGGSGLLGRHCILQLLAAGHEVTTTVRALARAGGAREMLVAGGAPSGSSLDFHAPVLNSAEG